MGNFLCYAIIQDAAFYQFKTGPLESQQSRVDFYPTKPFKFVFRMTTPAKQLTHEKEQAYDAMIDPLAASKCMVHKVKITFHPWLGNRTIEYFDQQNTWFFGWGYRGPADIRENKYRHDLIKPSYLLNSIKIVEEDNCIFFPYLYRRITYQDDGTIKVEISKKHRFIQLASAGILLSSAYSLYTSFMRKS
jgi:hypothetical protein